MDTQNAKNENVDIRPGDIVAASFDRAPIAERIGP
jgi:hypothetical protein